MFKITVSFCTRFPLGTNPFTVLLLTIFFCNYIYFFHFYQLYIVLCRIQCSHILYYIFCYSKVSSRTYICLAGRIYPIQILVAWFNYYPLHSFNKCYLLCQFDIVYFSARTYLFSCMAANGNATSVDVLAFLHQYTCSLGNHCLLYSSVAYKLGAVFQNVKWLTFAVTYSIIHTLFSGMF